MSRIGNIKRMLNSIYNLVPTCLELKGKKNILQISPSSIFTLISFLKRLKENSKSDRIFISRLLNIFKNLIYSNSSFSTENNKTPCDKKKI